MPVITRSMQQNISTNTTVISEHAPAEVVECFAHQPFAGVGALLDAESNEVMEMVDCNGLDVDDEMDFSAESSMESKSSSSEDEGATDVDEEDDYDYTSKTEGENQNEVIRKPRDQELPCPETGCTKVYKNHQALHQHKLTHQRLQCHFPGCPGYPTQTFANRFTVKRHWDTQHPGHKVVYEQPVQENPILTVDTSVQAMPETFDVGVQVSPDDFMTE